MQLLVFNCSSCVSSKIANLSLLLFKTSKRAFEKVKIAVPPITLQNQFSEIVKQIDKQKFEIEKSLKETQELYESLMEKYFG